MFNWEISPKTAVFIMDAMEFMISDIDDALVTYPMGDDEKAEQMNDRDYYAAILSELKELKEENETDVDVETV